MMNNKSRIGLFILKNSNLLLVPILRFPDYLFLITMCLLCIIIYLNGLQILSMALIIFCFFAVLLHAVSQPKLYINRNACTIIWSRWFQVYRCRCSDILCIELSVETQYLWAGNHLAFNTIWEYENAKTNLIVKENVRLGINEVTDKFAMGQSKILAEILSDAVHKPVKSVIGNKGYLHSENLFE